MLSLHLLGQIRVERDGEALALPPSKKTRALLAYLALTGGPHRRERLCEMFWDIPDDPRGALRWSLSKIRGLVDESAIKRVLADRETVAFAAQGADIDLLALRGLLSQGPDPVSLGDLVAAAAAFSGPFLEGLDLPESHHFHAWCIAEREAARMLRVRILTTLVDRLGTDPEAALPHARILAEIEPQDETVWARLVGILATAGRRSEAADQGELARRVLEDQGSVPSGSLLRAIRSLRRAPPAGLVALGAAGAVAPSSPNESQHQQEIRFCHAPDGVRIAYAVTGQGMPMVKTGNWLTHLDYDWQSPVWQHWTRQLTHDHRLVRYDERGNGLSDWDVPDLSFDTSCLDLETVIAAAGLERFVLFGLSKGCSVAITYAARHPEQVTHLVLYGGYARGWMLSDSPEEVARNRALCELIEHGWGQDNPAFHQVFTSLFMPEATAEQMRWMNELQRITTTPGNALRMENSAGVIDVRPLLSQLQVPTLVAHCRRDGVVPFAEGRLLAKSIPGARFVPLEGRNHVILENEPAWPQFLGALHGFLAS